MAAAAPRARRDRASASTLWTAASAGDELIESHDETTTGARAATRSSTSCSTGRATFTVDDEEVDAPAGTLVLVEVGTHARGGGGRAAHPVLVLGGKPGAALPASPFEHYYAAQPAYDAGDYDRAVAIASEGLADWPDHPLIHYQLACFHARAGRLDDARRSLDIAFASDERTREWAAEDDDLAALRE